MESYEDIQRDPARLILQRKRSHSGWCSLPAHHSVACLHSLSAVTGLDAVVHQSEAPFLISKNVWPTLGEGKTKEFREKNRTVCWPGIKSSWNVS